MPDPGRMLVIARIGAPHGIRGEVRIRSFASDPAALTDYGPLVSAQGRRFIIEGLRPAGKALVARIRGIDSREKAEALNGLDLHVGRESLPETDDENEFYAFDLAGLAVVGADGETVGTVAAVHDFGAGDILEIDLATGGREMFAFTREIFPTVDLTARKVIFVPPETVSERDRGDDAGEGSR